MQSESKPYKYLSSAGFRHVEAPWAAFSSVVPLNTKKVTRHIYSHL